MNNIWATKELAEWNVQRRITGDGWNVVTGDGLHIGPFEHDKARALVRDHNAEMKELLDFARAQNEVMSWYRIGKMPSEMTLEKMDRGRTLFHNRL